MAAATTTVIGVLGLGLGVKQAVSQREALAEQQAAADKQAKAQKNANAVASAQEQVNSRIARQRQARQERVRRAQLLSSSSMSGTLGSSGLIGANSAIGSNFGQAIAQQRAQTNTAFAVSGFNQQAANASAQFSQAGRQAAMAESSYKNNMSILSASQGLYDSIWGP